MTFTVNLMGKRVKLQALISSAECKFLSDVDLYMMVHMEGRADIEELFLITTAHLNQVEESTELQELLLSYQDIFEEPVCLTPERGVENQILLKPGSTPRQQYPYRISHTYKNEIDKIVKDLLDSGVIQHCKSLASPVILVKKKDVYWRLVDYKYRNESDY